MRLIFAGTPEVAVPTLHALITAGHEIALVLTREDAPRGRKRVLTPSEVAVAAEQLGLPVRKANRITTEVVEELRSLDAELGVVVAFGALFRADALAAPKRGWINLHFSLLPQWRGAAPVQRSLMNSTATGVTVFQLDEGVDTGPIWVSQTLPVSEQATAGDVLSEFAEHGAPLVVRAISAMTQGAQPTPQVGPASHAAKLTAADGELRAEAGQRDVLARFRGVTPEPGAWIALGDDRIKILEAHSADASLPLGEFALVGGEALWGVRGGALALRRVQPAGKSAMSGADWMRGRR